MKKLSFLLIVSLGTALQLGAQLPLNPRYSRVLGALTREPVDQLTSLGPNIVEGREFNSPQSVAVDTSVSPPILYVADTLNNRVLAWRNARQFSNGAPADLVLGQRDRFSNLQLGPNTSLSIGFTQPTGVAVDDKGRVYVADTGNHRILRFKPPFSQPPDNPAVADLVIGQANFTSKQANRGQSNPSAGTLNLRSSGGLPYRTSMVFDRQGNLWFTDAGNHRVLRYPASRLADGAPNGPEADLVLGQPDFTTAVSLALTAENRVKVRDQFSQPSGLAFDSKGRLYVADALSRVLVFDPNLATGVAARRVMGVAVVLPNQPPPTPVNETGLNTPEGIVIINDIPLVLDSGNNRIVRFDPYESWPAETATLFSPPAKAVIGQINMASGRANRGGPEPSAGSFSTPVHAIFDGTEVFVADSGNHRVLVFGDLSQAGPTTEARRVLGQVGFDLQAPNQIDGRELNLPQGFTIDITTNPPPLYVADTLNNRILGYRDVRRVKLTDRPEVVIGQPDFQRSVRNYRTSTPETPTPTGLYLPQAVAVDSEGNLWVADSGNGRVLRFRKPFEGPPALPSADLVIGQSDFTSRSTDPSSRTMGTPAGIAFTPDGLLLVSDASFNRVLLFRPPFTSGMAASRVIGQPDFFSTRAGTETNRMNAPRHIATDTYGRLYVADLGNSRILIFSNVAVGVTDPFAVFELKAGLRNPQGVCVSPLTDEIWVADTPNNRVLRYPRFDRLLIDGDRPDYQPIPEALPQAVGLDPFGNLMVADGTSRIVSHYPGMFATNAANGLPRMAAGMYATLKPVSGLQFGDEEKVFNQVAFPPMTRELGDVRVLFNDQPTPLHYVSRNQINFYLPLTAPSSGEAEIRVERVSTGQILASVPVQLDVASPALFTASGTGTGQVAAVNQDGTINSPSNPIARGQVISLYGTGQGPVIGAPPDGEPATGAPRTAVLPRVFISSDYVADSDIQYSGFTPGAVGLWQINVRIPERVPPGNAIRIFVSVNDIPSITPPLLTTIAVKQ